MALSFLKLNLSFEATVGQPDCQDGMCSTKPDCSDGMYAFYSNAITAFLYICMTLTLVASHLSNKATKTMSFLRLLE
ncbi:hypothetical protein K0M31_006766 [Melipona bicolor]|uniref:Uncharacterized protein n=1 Tax=Melipona bicolor TaxID=60889 RepID=A0AA40FSX6_9HYME|nr:hypothetical protein K0M31_006766 [Melipona bicolor]